MKTKMLILVVLLLGAAGCQQEQAAGFYKTLTETINTSVNAQQEATHKIIAAIDESKIADMTEVREYTGKLDEYIDLAQIAATEAAKVYEEQQAEDKIAAAIEAARKANIITSPLNPYAPVIEAVLGIAAIVTGTIAYKKNKALSTVSTKYEAHKRGVEATMRSATPEDARELYYTIGAERNKLSIV